MDDTLTLAALIAGLALIGALSGFLAGLLGIGGGIIIVPALYYVEGLLGVAEVHRMHLAVGTSLAVIIVTSLVSLSVHRRYKAVDFRILRAYGPGVVLGVGIGTLLAALVSGRALTAVFAVCALGVSINMLRGESAKKLGEAMPGPAGAGAMGLFTGIVSTMAGIGGGAITVALLTLYSVPIHIAVGTASSVGVLVSVPGAAGFALIGASMAELPPASVGYVNLAAVAAVAPTTALLAPVGARLAHRLPRAVLARVFALFLGAAALHMLWELR